MVGENDRHVKLLKNYKRKIWINNWFWYDLYSSFTMDNDRYWNKNMSEYLAIIIIVCMIGILAGIGVYNNWKDKKYPDLNPEFWED